MKLKPLYDHVIVSRAKADTVSKGGIYIPPTAQEKTSEGVVIAVGPGKVLGNGSLHPLDVQVGDTVLFDKYGATEIKVNGEEYIVLREQNIVCVLLS